MSRSGAHFRRRGGIRPVALALSALLAAGGATAVGAAVLDHVPSPPPQPTANGTGGRPFSLPPATAVASTELAGRQSVGPSVPISITIPAIGVTSSLLSLGLNQDGTIAVPQPGPQYNDAAWYRYSPTPGQLGPAIIEGHVDAAATGPSVFYRLGSLRPGDQVRVVRLDGSVVVFTVDAVRSYPKASFPTAAVYGNTPDAELRLITCGGDFDRATGHYLNDIVAFADLKAVDAAKP